MPPDSWVSSKGHPLQIRSGRLDDIDLFLEFERHLSPGTKYFRFGKFRDLGFKREEVLEIFDPDNDGNVHYVVTTTENSREVMIASGRLAIPASAHVCELLVVVRDDWHGNGVGRRLVSALCQEATRRGVSCVFCQVMPTNRPMQLFMHRCGFRQAGNPDNDVLLRFEKSVAASAAHA